MYRCPICHDPLRNAIVVCGVCGEELPLRVVVISEGSHGGGIAVALPLQRDDRNQPQEEVNGRCSQDDK
jgi:hypothetical protein